MQMQFCSLNSGSNGNCYYVGNSHDAVLVDAGISCREVEKRMKRNHLDLLKVRAILVSHEHTDHIKGIAVLAKKYSLPVYITSLTYQRLGFQLEPSLVVHFTPGQKIQIGSLEVKAFAKYHDACEPCSFTITSHRTTVGVFTDIGKPCTALAGHFKNCHAVFLESNYDEDMLQQGSYPYYLKQRIRGGNGHLSNQQALDVFLQHRHPGLQYLVLSHLSHNNNCPNLVEELFTTHAQGVQVVVAMRHQETEVYQVSANGIPARPVKQQHTQLALEFA